MKEKDIIFENGPYWVLKVKYGYDVYKCGVIHSTRCAIIGWKGERGLDKAKNEIDRRIKLDNEV